MFLFSLRRQDAPSANTMLVFRTLSNMFSFEEGCKLMQKNMEKVMPVTSFTLMATYF